jgi:hypothetical protein
VLAIAGNRRLPTRAGPIRADALPARAWQRLSAGPGADAADTGCWWLLVRRSRRTGELAFYRCYSPTPVRLSQLVAVAGRRWTVEESVRGG